MTKARDIASAAPAPSTVSATEIGYLDGVSSAIQTQIDSKIGSASAISPTLIDAKGDLIVGSAADTAARLAVGTNDYVLTADSSATNGVKWAALPVSGALVKITAVTFSGSSSQSFNDVFSATYRNYLIKCTFDSTSVQTEIRARLRVSGSDNTSNNYRSSAFGTNSGMSSTTLTGDGTGTISYWPIAYLEYPDAQDATSHFEIQNPYPTAYTNQWVNHVRYRGYDACSAYYNGSTTVTTSYTGITIYPATGTMTGKIEVYGYAL